MTTTTFPTAQQIHDHIHHDILADIDKDKAATAAMSEIMARGDGTPAPPDPSLEDIAAECRESGDWTPFLTAFEQRDAYLSHVQRQNSIKDTARRFHRRYSGTTRDIREREADNVLGWLQDQLPALQDAARGIDLDSLPGTAEEAVNAPPAALKAWRTATAIVDAYTALREEQASIVQTSVTGPNGRSLVRLSGQFRDALHLEHGWLENRRHTWASRSTSSQENQGPRPFRGGPAHHFFTSTPTAPYGPMRESGWPAGVDTVPARIAYLTDGRLDLWVPSIQELSDAHRAYGRVLDSNNWDSRGFLGRANIDGSRDEDDHLVTLANTEWKPAQPIVEKKKNPSHFSPEPKNHPGLRA